MPNSLLSFPNLDFKNLLQPRQDQDAILNMMIQPPEHEASDRLKAMLDQFPERQPNTMLQKVFASLAALGTGGPQGIVGGQPIGYNSDPAAGAKLKQDLLDKDYNRSLSDYAMKLKPIGELADTERAHNTNERLLASSLMTNNLGRSRLEETQRNNDLKNENADEDRKVREKMADIASLRATQPEYHAVTDKDGILHLYNEKDGKIIKTDIDTGKLSDTQKAQLRLEGTLEAIQARFGASSDLENQRQENRLEAIDKRGGIQKELEDKRYPNGRPSAHTAANENATQRKVRLYTKAKEALDKHPEWKDYITIDPTRPNEFSVETPGKTLYMGGGSDDVKHEILGYIYGSDTPDDTKVQTGTSERDTAIAVIKAKGKVVNDETIKETIKRIKANASKSK